MAVNAVTGVVGMTPAEVDCDRTVRPRPTRPPAANPAGAIAPLDDPTRTAAVLARLGFGSQGA